MSSSNWNLHINKLSISVELASVPDSEISVSCLFATLMLLMLTNNIYLFTDTFHNNLRKNCLKHTKLKRKRISCWTTNQLRVIFDQEADELDLQGRATRRSPDAIEWLLHQPRLHNTHVF